MPHIWAKQQRLHSHSSHSLRNKAASEILRLRSKALFLLRHACDRRLITTTHCVTLAFIETMNKTLHRAGAFTGMVETAILCNEHLGDIYSQAIRDDVTLRLRMSGATPSRIDNVSHNGDAVIVGRYVTLFDTSPQHRGCNPELMHWFYVVTFSCDIASILCVQTGDRGVFEFSGRRLNGAAFRSSHARYKRAP